MVKLLKQSSISLHFEENTGSSRWTTKARRTRTRSATFKQKYSSLTRRKTIFLKPKMTGQYGERVDDDRLEAGYRRELSRIRKDAVKMAVETTEALTGGDITRRKAMQIRALKET